LNQRAIRFRILFILYYNFFRYSDITVNTKIIIEDAGLSVVDQDLVTANIIYLHNKDYLRGKFYAGSATPVFLKITPSGIDYTEELIKKFDNYLNQQQGLSKDEISASNLLNNAIPEERLKTMHSIFMRFPALFDNFCNQL
jgi:hypothetical protein